VLPLLKQQHSNKPSADGSGAALSTVEARIIGAGLKALKGEDAAAIEELFGVFAVTQEDCVHLMPAIELLWRSCCASGSSGGDDLGMRLKVRQWTQMLVDHSLLLGSFTKGVHVHDIVLTYLRNTHSPSELRALQKQIVEEFVRMSTARAFEDTGSTSKAFAGEEVDWYVCNVGSFHIKQSMDRSVPVVEDTDVARWLMVEDTVLFQQTALAVGGEELEALAAHFAHRNQWVEAAKARWAVYYVSSSQAVEMMDEVVELLEKCGPTRTSGALQLELDVIGAYKYQGRYGSGTAERTQISARVTELSQNPSLRTNPWNIALGAVFPKLTFLVGAALRAWEDGKKADGDSVLKGMNLWYSQATPLMQSACDNAVGARKVMLVDNTMREYACTCDTDMQCFVLKEWFTLAKLLCISGCCYVATAYVTEESAALFQTVTDKHWGTDCSKMLVAISVHAFDRHFQIARTTAFRADGLLHFPVEWVVAEKAGNIQHCIDINDRKYRTAESYMRAAPPPAQDLLWFISQRGSFIGVEAHHQHLQPRQNILRLLEYAGINDTQQAEEGYRASIEWMFFRTVWSSSSADGLHHTFHEHVVVALIRALLSLSVGARNVALSWLDELPPADATTLHCIGGMCSILPTTARVLVAEVFEQQGRHADATRFAQTDLQDYHNLNVLSKVRAGRVLGRCHAALGQHMLSVSAFDAAIELAQSRKLLLSEALSVRGRAAAGRSGAGGSGLHWDEETGKQRLAEVMGRMQGPREVLERALLLPQ
jgi:hypothetical protein